MAGCNTLMNNALHPADDAFAGLSYGKATY